MFVVVPVLVAARALVLRFTTRRFPIGVDEFELIVFVDVDILLDA